MSAGKVIISAFVLGIALWITYILSGMLAGFIIAVLPLDFLGDFAVWAYWGIQILCMGFVAGFILKYIK